MFRISRDSPGMERNVPRPGQVYSGTMRRPGMNYTGAKFSDFAVMFFKNRKVKIYLQKSKVLQNKNFRRGIFRLCAAHVLFSPAPICID